MNDNFLVNRLILNYLMGLNKATEVRIDELLNLARRQNNQQGFDRPHRLICTNTAPFFSLIYCYTLKKTLRILPYARTMIPL